MHPATRTRALLAGLLLVIASLQPTRAQAYAVSVPVTILSSTCTSGKATWRGEVQSFQGYWPGYQPIQPTGKFQLCVVKLKLKDSDKRGDYYALDVTTTFTPDASYQEAVQDGASNFFGPEPFNVRNASSEAAIDNVYDATPNLVQSTSAGGVTASFAIGPISISSASQLDAYTTVTRTSLTSTHAEWAGPYASSVSKLETVYSVKVKQRKKGQAAPVMSAILTAPYVTYRWKTFTAYAHGYPYTAYCPAQTLSSTKTITKKL